MTSAKTPAPATGAANRSLPPRVSAPPKSTKRRAPGEAPEPEHAVEAALEATNRTTTSLSGLLEALGQFTAGIAGAQEASEQLKYELERLRSMLGRSNEDRLALKERLRELEVQLVEARYETELEHKYVRDEQDRFIAALIDDYEAQIERLQRASQNGAPLHGAAGAPTWPAPDSANALPRELAEARQELRKLRTERDQLLAEREPLRELVRRVQEQRDQAQTARDRLSTELKRAQAKLEVLSGGYDDRDSTPTEPPPEASGLGARLRGARGIPLAQRPTEPPPRAARASEKPVSRPPELSEFEQEWDSDAAPAPPPSFEAGRLGDAEQPGLRISAPPAELQAALTSPLPLTNSEANSGANSRVRPQTRPTRAQPSQPAPDPTIRTSPTSVYPDPYWQGEKPPLKRKPDHSLRPLVGYSKGADEIEPEQLARIRSTHGDRSRRS